MMRDFGDFVGAVGSSGWPWPRFGQSTPIDLDTYMSELNAQILAFDAWATDVQQNPGPETLGQSFFGGWHSFVFAVPPSVREHRPSGWRSFFDTTYPSVLPGQVNATLWAATAAFEREFIRYYDKAIDGGGSPPLERPTPPAPPAGQPPPGQPPPVPEGPPEAPKPTPLEQSSGFSTGLLFMAIGGALYLAGRRK